MIIYYFKLPKWKAYLYDLKERVRIFKRINLRKWVPGFNVKPGDVMIIKNCLKKFGKGEVVNKRRAFIYKEYVDVVEKNQSRVTQNEFELAVRISRIKKLNLGELIMELSELKTFAKEVGMGISDYKGLDEDELTLAIIRLVDPKKKKYSSEFVAWYEDLDEDLFNEDADAKKKSKGKKTKAKDEDENDEDNEVEFDAKEVIDAIENADKVKELHEIVEAFPNVFSSKLLKVKDMEELQEKMMEVIEEMDEEKENKGKKEKKTEKKKGLDKAETKEMIKLIQECDDASDLKALIKEYDNIFGDIETRGKATLEKLQKKMLEALGVEVEDDDDEKPKTKAKAKKKESDLEEELNEMGFMDLKKYAKEAGVKVPPGTNKEKTIAMILEAAEEGDDEDKEIELNPSIVKTLVKEKDLESLQAAAKEMGIALKALEKRSCKAIGEKLIEALSEKPKASKKEKLGGSKKKEKVSVWETVKEMVEEGISGLKIKKAIAEILVEMGIDEDEAANKAKVLIEIAKAESE
jgi:hypothetical protein